MSTSPTTFSFPKAEHTVLEFWKEHNIFEKSLIKTKDKPIYTFYDGPPFATGLPHHGHLLASTIKDIIPRYFTMNGYYVERRFGWDCHGLPIEYEIDKQFDKSTHEIVSEKGVAYYNQACRGIVQRYAQQWEETITRIGRWVDFKNDYKTMNPEFMESVWWVFKRLWEKELIYQGTKVMPYSTALCTGLSNFEAGSNYQDVQDPAVIVLLKLIDEEASLAIWTTTPWTLPSNLGVCVNPDLTYIKVKDKQHGQIFYLAQARLETLSKQHDLEVIEEISGSSLIGRSYEPLFPYFSQLKEEGAFQVQGDAYVTTEDGTGLVHLAPAFGEDDARVMQAAGVTTLVCPVDAHGRFTSEVGDSLQGCYVKDADKLIIKQLKEQGLLYEQATIVHSYPFCPRSDTPLIYRAIPSWYVRVESLKDKLIANNNQIHWVPSHIKQGRFGKWLEGARDWAISRNRVWGTPLPLWKNEQSGNIICMGSLEELESYVGKKISDLHRDVVDELTFTLPNEPGVYQRISDVLDCWFESGSMPYAQQHYPFTNKEKFEENFPAEFIAEGLDQTRGWFYLLNVLSTALFDMPAFKNVIVNGIVMAEDGKKMSKRLKNYTPPDELMEQYGADALRLYLINSGLVKAEEQRFSDNGVKEMVRATLIPWYNSFKFLQTYASVDKWSIKSHAQSPSHILDQWIMSRLQSLITLIHQHMQAYELFHVVPELLLFIDDLTNVYIRLNRGRFWGEGLEADKCAAYTTLFTVIKTFSTCMAPFTPFLAETIYQSLKTFDKDTESVAASIHLCDYPIADDTKINQDLEAAVIRLKQILVLGRQKRNDAKIKIKTPLRQLTVIHQDQAMLNEIKKLETLIKQELNIKKIVYTQDESSYINLFAKPNSPILGKRLQKRFGHFKKQIEQLSSSDIKVFEDKGELVLEGEVFTKKDILIFREAQKDSNAVTNRFISIDLDTQLDQSLIDEGMAREVINRIQKTRKALDFNVDDRINIVYQSDSQLSHVIEQHKAYIGKETLGLSIESNDIQHADFQERIEEHELTLKLEKIQS